MCSACTRQAAKRIGQYYSSQLSYYPSITRKKICTLNLGTGQVLRLVIVRSWVCTARLQPQTTECPPTADNEVSGADYGGVASSETAG